MSEQGRFANQAEDEALTRLLEIACTVNSGQARRVADFLLAWYNAEENGAWNPTDLWNVDAAIAKDMLTVLQLIRQAQTYPDELGFQREMQEVWKLWRDPEAEPLRAPLPPSN